MVDRLLAANLSNALNAYVQEVVSCRLEEEGAESTVKRAASDSA